MTKSIFTCECCNYSTRNKYDWNKHTQTKKHIRNSSIKSGEVKLSFNPSVVEEIPKQPEHICECGKTYKYYSGLSRHKTKCKYINSKSLTKTTDSSIVQQQRDQIASLESLLKKTIESQQETLNSLMGKVGNTTNTTNNTINNMQINFFLNEECKNAMNLTDFIENVKVSLEDLSYTKEHGYAKGISNILVKHLNDMDPKDRPIHCSDKKRLQFYIKEEDKWGKDTDNVKIDKSIDDVSKKQIKQIAEWQHQNPGYVDNDRLLNEYFKITRHVMGGGDINEIIQNGNEIKKNISSEVEIKEAMIKKNI